MKRFQELKAKVEPQVQALESEIETLRDVVNDLLICPYCSREYKQKHHFDNHIAKCKEDQNKIAEKKAELERLQKEIEEKQKALAEDAANPDKEGE